jgi:hypothetical protein
VGLLEHYFPFPLFAIYRRTSSSDEFVRPCQSQTLPEVITAGDEDGTVKQDFREAFTATAPIDAPLPTLCSSLQVKHHVTYSSLSK